jgi:uncharacterized protein YoxC
MQETTVVNLPPEWIMWLGCIGMFLFGLGTMVIAIAVFMLRNQVSSLLGDAKQMTEETTRQLPSMLTSVNGTLKNVKSMSDDAETTVHNVTGTVNRVSHVVGSVAGRMESPVIRAVGALTGVMAGMKALRGNQKEVVVEKVETKKRGKRFGLFG